MKWRDVLLGRTVTVAAMIAITVLGFKEEFGWQERTIIGLGVLMILQSGAAAIRERMGTYRLGRRYPKVLRRVLDLMVDLSELTAGNPRPWIVELYLPRHEWTLRSRPPFLWKRTLWREMSATLGVPPVSPSAIDSGHALFGECFTEGGRVLWWDPGIANCEVDLDNRFGKLREATNDKLKEMFGMLGVWAIVDDRGRDCEGLLVIHTNRDVERTTQVLGALGRTRARYRVMNAVKDVHEQMRAR